MPQDTGVYVWHFGEECGGGALWSACLFVFIVEIYWWLDPVLLRIWTKARIP